ncbi:FlgO family outer membrane protein [Vibrio sp.]|nr:FlgO family outer membrane protein [Vibrio sp.]
MVRIQYLLTGLFLFILQGCAPASVYNGKGEFEGSQLELLDRPRHTVDYFIESLTEELMLSNTSISTLTPMAVTSFVDIEHYDATNWLGNTVSEGFMHQLQRRGFKIVDFKSTGTIQVTDSGDFTLSRNWQELAGEQEVQYILTGTMLRQEGGVLINARVVGARSNVIVATAQGFLPASHVGRSLDSLNSLRSKDGALIRENPYINQPHTVIIRP